MRTLINRQRIAFVLIVTAAVCAAGLLLRAEPLQPVGAWMSIGPVAQSRSGAAAVTLADGRTLIAGGTGLDGAATDGIVAYDPTSNSFENVGRMIVSRVGHTATLLKDNRVLFTGGLVDGVVSSDIEMYDPATRTSTLVALLVQPRVGHAAARLADDTVLIVGGTTVDGVILRSAEIADPATGNVMPALASLQQPRTGATATTLAHGHVLVAGGNDGSSDLRTAELYDGFSQTFAVAETQLSEARSGHTAVLLPHNNSVLIAGGTSATVPVDAADLFLPAEFPDPFSYGVGWFTATGSMTTARTRAIGGGTSVDGYAFVAGGGSADAEVYRFPTIKTDKDDYVPGERAVITGTGWQTGEAVKLVFQEDPAVHDDYVIDRDSNGDPIIVADGNGDIYYDQWAPEQHDLGIRFYLMATGKGSLRRAQTTFTDGGIRARAQASGNNIVVAFPASAVTLFASTTCTGTPGTTSSPFITTDSNGSGYANTGLNASSGSFSIAAPSPVTIGGTTYAFSGWVSDGNNEAHSSTTGTTGCFNDLGNGQISVTANYTAAASTTTTVASANNPSTYGQSVTFTATVSATSTPTGSVNFVIDGGSPIAGMAGATTATTATWTYTTSGLNATNGTPHTVSASYVATGSFGNSSGSLSGGQVVNKATPTATLAVSNSPQTYTGTGLAATVGISASSVPGTVATILTGGAATQTPVGTYAVTADFVPVDGANYNSLLAVSAGNFVIDKANAVVVVTPYDVVYDGQPHTATVMSITGVNGETGAAVGTVDVSNTTHTNAGTYASDSWSFTGTANYNDIAATTITDEIDKADATFTVTGYDVVYDGQAHTATVSAITGVNGETGAAVGTVDVSNTTHTNAGTYASDSWSFTGTANYNDIAATTITDEIDKADATFTVTGYDVVYDGQAHTATVSAITGVNGETGATVGTVDVSGTAHTNAGTYNDDPWTFTGTANYKDRNGAVNDRIDKATAVVVVTPYDVVYDGQPHTATVASITGVNGETGAAVGTVDVSNTTHTTAGTYASDSWSFTGTANYSDIAATTITDEIDKADAVIAVTGYDVTYDGTAHTATGTATGAGGENLSALLVLTGTTHTAAGSYPTDPWSFPGDANHNSDSGTVADTIDKASAVVVVTPYDVVYDGQPHTATVVSITGVNGETGAAVGTVDVSNTTHTNAGAYASDSWSFTGTANYNDIAPTTITDEIDRATATFTITGYDVVYDGQAHTATVSAITGVNGETGATVGTVDVSGTAHTNAGTYNDDPWTFTGTANYKDSNGAVNDRIDKATAVVMVTPYDVVYDGQPHTATVASITGVNGETGAAVGTVDVSNTTHTNAGTYASDSWSFTGTANYSDIAATTITDEIDKADAVIAVTGYDVTYDGTAHTATGTATGAGGENLSALLVLTGTTHTAAGSYPTDPWSFPGDANHNSDSGTVADTIDKADAVVVVTPYDVVYDGQPHTAAVVSITGVNGETGAAVGTVDVSNTTHTNAGTYASDSWSFTGTANYNDIAPTTITDEIDRATATFTVTGYDVVYDGQAHAATVSAITGVNGETGATVGTVNVNGTAHTNAGTYNNDPWTFTGTANYKDSNGAVNDRIDKANASFTVTPYNVQWDGNPHIAAVSTITGVNGETGATVGTVNVNHTTHTSIGTYTSDYWFFTGTANYSNIGNTTITDVITTAYCFNGFLSPIGGSVEGGNGGSFADPVRAFKLGSTIPVKFMLNSWNGSSCGAVVTTGIHTLQAIKYSNATDADPPINATPTDAATTGNQFRLTGTEWHFNLSTKSGFTTGTWLLKATLLDGSEKTVWVTLKK